MTATRWLKLKVTKTTTNHCLCSKDVVCHFHERFLIRATKFLSNSTTRKIDLRCPILPINASQICLIFCTCATSRLWNFFSFHIQGGNFGSAQGMQKQVVRKKIVEFEFFVALISIITCIYRMQKVLG